MSKGIWSGDPVTPEGALPREVAELSVGHLQLDGRAAALTARFETIGDLVHAFHAGAVGASEGGRLQLRRLLNCLTAALRESESGWDHFRRTRPSFVSASSIYFYSPGLERLGKRERSARLARLHLSRRAINALETIGVSKLEQLVARAREGITRLDAAGELTTIEIVDSLDALVGATGGEGRIDWVSFAERRGFQVLPARAQWTYSGKDFLAQFPRVCQEAVLSKFGRQGAVVLQHRILRHADILVPLTEIGRHLGQTGERVRLLEGSIMKMLKRAIWRDEYRGCRFRFRPAFVQPLYDLAAAIQARPPGALSLDDWRALLREIWDVDAVDVGQQERILFQMLGLDHELMRDLPLIGL